MHQNMRRGAALVAIACGLMAAPAAADSNNNNSEKLQKAVTLEGVRTHQAVFQQIADSTAEGNRFAGLPGYELSAQYVFDTLKAAGYNPTFHNFTYNAFFEQSPSQLNQVSPSPTTYVNGVDFSIMTYSGPGEVTAPLQRPPGPGDTAHLGCFAADYAGFTSGNIAIVQRGTPPNFNGACTFRIKANNAIAAGASAVVIYNNVAGILNGTLGEAGGLTAKPVLGMTQALGQSLVAQMGSGPVVMHVKTDTVTKALPTRNVLAETAGGDPNNVVMVGAHLDSVSAGPGIQDNGSGSAAILETAVQMAKVKPRNKVRFAWWSAEESSLVGSTRYVDSLSAAELDRIALYLNFDMIGSPNHGFFVYDGDNSKFTLDQAGVQAGPPGSGTIESIFYGFYERAGEFAEPTPFNGRSDYGPFIAKGIPAGGLFTGAEQPKTAEQVLKWGGTAGLAYDPCYHSACDTFDNINLHALDVNSDAVAHSTITFAQSTEAINGVRGKGNFKRPYQGGEDGGTTGPGGGGGLHDDHEES